MIIKEEKRRGADVYNFLIFFLVLIICSWLSLFLFSGIGYFSYFGYVPIFIPLIIWVKFKYKLIKEKPGEHAILRFYSFILLVVFIVLIIFEQSRTPIHGHGWPMYGNAIFYYPFWLFCNVSLFEFSNRLGINILLKLVAFILLIFLGMPFAFMLT